VEEQAADLTALLADARRGDSGAFCELCRLCETRLLRQALALCGNVTLAEDLAQETFFEAWKSLRRYSGRCHFFTWLCSIMIHRYRNLRRKKFTPTLSSLSLDERSGAQRAFETIADPAATPDQTAEISERALFLQRCLDHLPEKQRAVIFLRFYVDDSLEGIAASLGCSVGTVKSRLFHALDRLTQMKELQKHYG
jgi:RNA polymerase sigma-70 factor (ECF subfamily)